MEIEEKTTEIEAWASAELLAMEDKLTAGKARVETLSEKIEEWKFLEEKHLIRKAVASLRSTFRKPSRHYMNLLESGDDIARAIDEKLKPYRLKRLIDIYAKHMEKLRLTIAECQDLVNAYPSLSEEVGGFDWSVDLPPLATGDGDLTFLTSSGAISSRGEV
jgi:hypothetical protein